MFHCLSFFIFLLPMHFAFVLYFILSSFFHTYVKSLVVSVIILSPLTTFHTILFCSYGQFRFPVILCQSYYLHTYTFLLGGFEYCFESFLLLFLFHFTVTSSIYSITYVPCMVSSYFMTCITQLSKSILNLYIWSNNLYRILISANQSCIFFWSPCKL